MEAARVEAASPSYQFSCEACHRRVASYDAEHNVDVELQAVNLLLHVDGVLKPRQTPSLPEAVLVN